MKNIILKFNSYLELSHFFIPNRSFELNDIIANIAGVLVINFLFFLKKKFINEKI